LAQCAEKYRAPRVLCALVGKTKQGRAREPGCPAGSIWWRPDRARELLKARLTRRGVSLTATALATLLAEQTQAAVPATLANAALASATLYAVGKAAATAAQAQVFNLAEGAMHTMVVNRLFRSAPAIGLVRALAAGVGAASYHLLADNAAQNNVLPPIVRSAQSGPWSAPATWEGGKVPAGNVRVVVREGHRLVYDVKAAQPV